MPSAAAPQRGRPDPLVVAVDGGRISGRREGQVGVRAFLGIPYAAAPEPGLIDVPRREQLAFAA